MLHAVPGLPIRAVQVAQLLLAAVCLLGGAGCRSWWCYDPGFDEQWDEVAFRLCPPDPYGPEGMAGLWEGRWESEQDGDSGELRAIVTPYGANMYYAQFHSTFARCIPFESGVELRTCLVNGVHQFSGAADLGCLAGGLFAYRGWASDRQFVATYHSEKDRGVFRMRRVPTSCSVCFESGGITGPAAIMPPPMLEPFYVETVMPAETPKTPADKPAAGE